jgi:hypothetical protein
MNITDIKLMFASVDVKEGAKPEAAKQYPLRQCSIDRVIAVLNIHHRTTAKNISKQSGLCETTVNKAIYHLLANEHVTVEGGAKTARYVTLLPGYTKSKTDEAKQAEREAKQAIHDQMIDEYLAGGVTMTELSAKYQINVSTIHGKISRRRGFNKNPIKSKYTPKMRKKIFELSESEKASAVARILGYPISTVVAMIAKQKTPN